MLPNCLTGSADSVKYLGIDSAAIPLAGGDILWRMETVAQRVRWVLQRTGWSQRELARRAGLSGSHISLIVTRLGEDVRPQTLKAIAVAAGVSEHWLLTGDGEPQPVVHIEPSTGPASDEVDWRAVPSFDRLPNWPQLMDGARGMRPNHPDYVWQHLGQSRPLLTARPTPGMVAELADVLLKYGEPPAGPTPRR